MDEDDSENKILLESAPRAGTLLPAPIASAVSLATTSSALYLRAGLFLGGLAIDGAKATTLAGVELSRNIAEAILVRAGRDVAESSRGQVGRAEAEGVLERTIGLIHTGLTSASFFVTTGFYISSAALQGASMVSLSVLSSLDAIFGSTESSRAVSSIITLIRKEFTSLENGDSKESVGLIDLIVGLGGLTILQRRSARRIAAEAVENNAEEVFWDVVVLDSGLRVDHENELNGAKLLELSNAEPLNEAQMEEQLRKEILQQLPPNAKVSVKTTTTTTKTVTVEIWTSPTADVSLPAGAVLIEDGAVGLSNGTAEGRKEREFAAQVSRKLVYELTRSETRNPDPTVGSLAIADGTLANRRGQSYGDIPSANGVFMDTSGEASPILSRRDSGRIIDVTSPPLTDDEDDQGLSFGNAANSKKRRSTSNVEAKKPKTVHVNSEEKTKPVAKARRPSDGRNEREQEKTEKQGAFKRTMNRFSNKEQQTEKKKESQQQRRPPWGSQHTSKKDGQPGSSHAQKVSISVDHDKSRQAGRSTYSPRELTVPRPGSRGSYYSIYERRRDSVVSQTDTFSVHSEDTDSRPGSPVMMHIRQHSSISRPPSELDMTFISARPGTDAHKRNKSMAPSLYTLQGNDSELSLVLGLSRQNTGLENEEVRNRIKRTGVILGVFPFNHIVRNICRFIRFSSASYGHNFLRVLGISSAGSHAKLLPDSAHHFEHNAFSGHTGVAQSTILLSSFVDPQGGSNAVGETDTGVPLVHFVCLDHESKAVVLTCRGTLGFEDILTDLTCEYDNLHWRNRIYTVHKGMHASARKLFNTGGGKILATIKAALEEFPDYGLVMCGHSLGGGVAALFAIMVSEPDKQRLSGAAFVTARPEVQLAADNGLSQSTRDRIILPPGRPVQVYAYGPPATMSAALRRATSGLITTVVNGQDIVPYLSLGVLHDVQAIALAFKLDSIGVKGEVQKQIWESLRNSVSGHTSTTPKFLRDEDESAFSALKSLRAHMKSQKLLPPGKVFVAESQTVLQRYAFTSPSGQDRSADIGKLGKPAMRVVLKYIRDVETRFGEITIGSGMLTDHSPGRYEISLAGLARGVLDE